MNREFNKKMTGYFTVEAAFIMPFVMLIMVFMIFMSFYCYDRCILEQCAYAAALRGSSNRFADVDEAYKEANTAAQDLVSDKLFAVKELKTTVRVSAATVTVTYECEVNMPVGNLLEDMLGDVLTIEVSKQVYRNKAVAFLRQL